MSAIVIVGAPGSGKSTVGALLAQRLGVEFTDVDEVIVERAGKSIADIFTVDGEDVFRALERETTLQVLERGGVISLGGGAVTSAEIRDALGAHRVIWLKVGAAAAASRIGLTEARPLLLGNIRGTLIKLMAERAPLYASVASTQIETDQHEPAAVVELIMVEAGSETKSEIRTETGADG